MMSNELKPPAKPSNPTCRSPGAKVSVARGGPTTARGRDGDSPFALVRTSHSRLFTLPATQGFCDDGTRMG